MFSFIGEEVSDIFLSALLVFFFLSRISASLPGIWSILFMFRFIVLKWITNNAFPFAVKYSLWLFDVNYRRWDLHFSSDQFRNILRFNAVEPFTQWMLEFVFISLSMLTCYFITTINICVQPLWRMFPLNQIIRFIVLCNSTRCSSVSGLCFNGKLQQKTWKHCIYTCNTRSRVLCKPKFSLMKIVFFIYLV